jgi:hypothetical protein
MSATTATTISTLPVIRFSENHEPVYIEVKIPRLHRSGQIAVYPPVKGGHAGFANAGFS